MTTPTILASLMATRARQLRVGEEIPAEVGFKMDGVVLDPEWVWVVEREGRIRAALMALHGHEMAVLMRLAAEPTAPLVPLFREMFRDLRSRGIRAYVVMLDMRVETERRLAAIAAKAGAVQLDNYCAVWAGPIVPEGV